VSANPDPEHDYYIAGDRAPASLIKEPIVNTVSAGAEPIEMSHPSHWLALLRTVVGLYFAKAIWTKLSVILVGGFVPLPAASERWLQVMPTIVAKQASENPVAFYKDFLEQTVIPHSPVFAQLVAWGEVVAGVGLTLGLFNGVAALVGLWLSFNYGLASFWQSPNQLGFHLVLVTCMVVFLCARSGRAWGLDAWLAWRFPGAWFTRRPFA
jgi:thiosulfate dehydrogenase [quinone] large subunit